jgi:hypothetical protein
MRVRLAIVCVIGALILSAGFIASGLLTYAWVTDVRKSPIHRAVRAFYLPHTLSAALVLDALEIGWTQDAKRATPYMVWFVASLPASLTYMLVGIGCIGLIRRGRRSPARQP